MREIKFRVWAGNKYRHFGNPVVQADMAGYGLLFPVEEPNVVVSKDYVVEEYTGLKDKNGVEIYEGDIMGEPSRHTGGDNEPFCIEWNEFQVKWFWKNINDDHTDEMFRGIAGKL